MTTALVEVPHQAFSAKELRSALGAFATGVTVITTEGPEHSYGMTANAFSSVSLDPPLILICIIGGTAGAEAVAANGAFAVNVLSAEQEPLSRYFSSKDRPRGKEVFASVSHLTGATGCPLLDGAAAHLDCRVAAQHEVGDHIVFIGEVVSLAYDPARVPLVFHAGRYRFLREE